MVGSTTLLYEEEILTAKSERELTTSGKKKDKTAWEKAVSFDEKGNDHSGEKSDDKGCYCWCCQRRRRRKKKKNPKNLQEFSLQWMSFLNLWVYLILENVYSKNLNILFKGFKESTLPEVSDPFSCLLIFDL